MITPDKIEQWRDTIAQQNFANPLRMLKDMVFHIDPTVPLEPIATEIADSLNLTPLERSMLGTVLLLEIATSETHRQGYAKQLGNHLCKVAKQAKTEGYFLSDTPDNEIDGLFVALSSVALTFASGLTDPTMPPAVIQAEVSRSAERIKRHRIPDVDFNDAYFQVSTKPSLTHGTKSKVRLYGNKQE